MKKTIVAVFCYVLFLVLTSCANPDTQPGYKIVSLSPAMTEIIYYLKAQDKLVGVTTYCDYPDEARSKTKVGDFSNPSIERIMSLKPDLVVVNIPEQVRIKLALEKLKIAVFISSPLSLGDIYEEITSIGKVIGHEAKAESLVEQMRKTFVRRNTSQKKVYIELSPRPLVTIGKLTFLNELVEKAGGINIFSDLNKDYPVVSQEEIIRRNPEIIIVLHPEKITDRTGWANVSAVKNGKVYIDLNPDFFLRPGPRLMIGYKQLEKIFE